MWIGSKVPPRIPIEPGTTGAGGADSLTGDAGNDSLTAGAGEDTLTGGIGGEIAAWIGEHCFRSLDAPVMRCASLDTPIPFSMELEKQFLAKSRLDVTLAALLAF